MIFLEYRDRLRERPSKASKMTFENPRIHRFLPLANLRRRSVENHSRGTLCLCQQPNPIPSQSAYGEPYATTLYLDIAILRQTLDDYDHGGLACDILDIDEVILFQDNLILEAPTYRSDHRVALRTIPALAPVRSKGHYLFGLLLSTTPTETMGVRSTSRSPTIGESVNQPTLQMTGISKESDHPELPHTRSQRKPDHRCRL